MIASGEVATALTGAWRLARLDARGLALFDATPDGFWKSFAAACIALPGDAIIYMLARSRLEAPLWREVAIGLIVYAISWVAFPLAMAGICELIDRRARYIGFIVAANWGKVLQTALMTPLALLSLYGGSAALLLYFAGFVAVLAYGWYIARTALQVDGFTAGGLVLFSVLLDLFITGFGDVLLIRE
jgi:hypothetical protein